MKILITGGADHRKRGLLQKKQKDGYGYAIKLDWGNKIIEKQLHYLTPDNNINPNITKELTCGHINNNELYVTSRTEVLVIDFETLRIKRKINSTTFNDLHHAMKIDKNIFVANTGLEMIQRYSLEGEELEQINLSSIPTWKRFDKNIDYRMVESTKPHEIHANYVFERKPGEIWATCLLPKKAICISEKKRCIDINEGFIHDGNVYEDSIFFTTTNGYLIEINRSTLKRKRTYNVRSQYAQQKGGTLGWCRGVGVAEGRAYIGFSVLRQTKNVEFLDNLLNKRHSLTTRIVEIELMNGMIVGEYILPYKKCSIFSIIPYSG